MIGGEGGLLPGRTPGSATAQSRYAAGQHYGILVAIMKRLTYTFFLMITFIVSCAPSNEHTVDEMVDIGTHSLHIYCLGSGRPMIVIDTGVGEKFESWDAIITELSRHTRVCAYDRAGYGQSESGPMPRDAQQAAYELNLLLTESGEDGPYILVGHSLGGLNMQVYANSYPEGVSGLVLLDPSPLAWMTGEGFPELRELFIEQTVSLREDAEAMKSSADPEAKAVGAFIDAMASEFEEFFGRTANEVAAINSFGELPLTVIGAIEPDPAFGEYGQPFRQFWNEENQALARKSSLGRYILAEGSSHHIHLDRPQLVIEAILDLMK